MTVSRIDYLFNMIKTANRSKLSKVKAAINEAVTNGALSPVMYRGLNEEIRNRADWLRSRK